MSNIGNLVDRTYREYLEPIDDLVSYTTLSTGINDSVTSVVYNGDLLSVEEEDALDAGTVIEIGQELMICTSLTVLQILLQLHVVQKELMLQHILLEI